jgi:signal transduction histidine kinase/CheY-like chemotaxis protein
MLLIFLAIWYSLKDNPFDNMVFTDLASIFINSLATLCLIYPTILSRKINRKLYYAWLFISASLFSYLLGDIFFAYYDLILEQSPSPSIADVFYLLSYPLFLIGAFYIPSIAFKSSERAKLLLDTGIVLISAILIYWSLFIAPIIELNKGTDLETMILAVAYPVGDLIQLFALIELLFSRNKKIGFDPLLFLGLFCAIGIIADAIYMTQSMSGSYVSGTLLDAVWIVSSLMICLAGISQAIILRSGKYVEESKKDRHYGEIMLPLYLPYVCAIIAFIMLIISYSHPMAVPFSVLSISVGAIIGLVLARQVLVLRENTILYKDAQDEIAERKHMQNQVIRLNQELERRVKERTSELEKTNKDLQKQIVERKTAEEALKDSERRLADIINFLPDATFVINRDGVVIAWNQAIEMMTGIKASQILGKGNYEYALPFYNQRRPLLADFALNSNLDMKGKYECLRRLDDNTLVGEFYVSNLMKKSLYLLGSAAVLYDSEGTVYGAIESIRDITNRKNVEEDLKTARDRAESATKAKSKFLANMSHEIRTPMNAVIGMSDLLLQMDLTIEQRDYLEIIRNSGNALLAIINDILDYSKIDGDKLELIELPFDLVNCIELSMDLVSAKAAKKGLELTYFIEDEVPAMLISDEIRLRQILINLLGNAVKFTEHGEVTLSVRSSPEPDGRVRVCFAIKDTGIGISKENQGRLFQLFSQVDTSNNRFHGGTGLGLAISRRLVEMMGGEISVESAPGEGSTFSFTILCSVHKQNHDSQPEDQLLAGKSVLIVQSSESLRKMLSCALVSWKMDVTESSEAQQAIDLLEQSKDNHFDAAIVDALLPGIDAKALCKQLRITDRISFILVTSHIGSNFSLASFADGRIAKPIKPRQLKRVLISLLQPKPQDTAYVQSRAHRGKASEDSSISILLAEDNEVNQKVALTMLKRLNYRADVAENGLAVLTQLEKKNYDVILMDIQMPDMDGIDATHHIRELNGGKQPYIIAMTAYALDGDREKFLEAGMNDYLSKPIRIDELKNALEKYERSQHAKHIMDDET